MPTKKKPVPIRALRTQSKSKGKASIISVQTARLLERRYKVMTMRRDGVPLHEIASILGCGVDTVRNDVKEVMGQTATAMYETTEEARNLERTRLDSLTRKYMPLALNGNMGAAQLVMAISRDLRKMESLDVPEIKKTEETGVRVYVGVDIDLV